MKKAAIIISVVVVILVGGIVCLVCLDPSIRAELAFFKTQETQAETQPTKPIETQPPKIKTLTVSGKDKLDRGDSTELSVKYTPENAPIPNLSWHSSDDSVASVDNKGLVKAVAMGECEITASVADSDVKSVLKIKVTDKYLEKVNELNNYLIKIPDSRLEPAGGSSTVMLSLEGASIDDFNADGKPELLLRLKSASGFVFSQLAVLDNAGNAREIKSFDSYTDVFEKKYSSYDEEFLINDKKDILIKATAIKNDPDKKTRTRNVTVTVYSPDGESTLRKFEDIYKYKDSELKTVDKGDFKIDAEKAEEAYYIAELSAMTKGCRELKGDIKSRNETVTMGKFVKLEPVCKLDSAYMNKIEWKCDKPEIAKINESGVVTGVRSGSCVVTGTLNGLDSAVARAVINVRESSAMLSKYLREVKGKAVTAENGLSLSFKGSMTADVDDDGTKELLLYYKNGASVQLDVCKEKNSKIERTTAFSDSKNSGDVDIEVFVNNANDKIVISENNYIYTAHGTLKFAFYEYENGKYKKRSSDYQVVYGSEPSNGSSSSDGGSSSSGSENLYYQDGNKITKAEFERQTGHYSKYMGFTA